MTKQELQDKYFYDFLKWCCQPPKDAQSSDLIFWIDHHSPIEENFWEYMVGVRKEIFNA